jgi:hypothetical protein
MEISVAVATRPDVPLDEELRMAALADRLGYGELWVGEGWVWDSFALATAIGVATERIAITVGPLPVQVRDPATIARRPPGWRGARHVERPGGGADAWPLAASCCDRVGRERPGYACLPE